MIIYYLNQIRECVFQFLTMNYFDAQVFKLHKRDSMYRV